MQVKKMHHMWCGNFQSANLYVCYILYCYYVFPFVIHLRGWPGGGAYAVYPLTSVALAWGAVSVRSLQILYIPFFIFLYSIETGKWTYTETRNKSRVVFETRAAILRRRSCSASVKAQTLNDVDARQHIHVAVIINCNCQRDTDGCS